MEELFQRLLAGVAAVLISIGTLTAAAYWLFKLFSDKWLTAKFNERLEAFKHKQQTELEQLRFTINALMDRATKLHQREFEVLPEAWGLLTDAHGIVRTLVSPSQQYSDVDRMDGPALSEFLAGTELSPSEKEQIVGTTKRTDLYGKLIAPYKMRKARNASWEFYRYFRKNGIFISPPLKEAFSDIDELIHKALNEHEGNLEMSGYASKRLVTAQQALLTIGEQKLKALEIAVANRLWDGATLKALSVAE